MLRAIGAILIILACASFGFLAERRLSLRIRALSSILPALEILKAEIGNLLTPIPEAFLFLSCNAAAPASALFSETYEALAKGGESFADAFSGVLREKAAKSGFYPEDAAVLNELSPVLGRYGAEEQSAKLKQVICRLEEARTKACEDHDQRGRLYKTMGIMLGIVLVLVTL